MGTVKNGRRLVPLQRDDAFFMLCYLFYIDNLYGIYTRNLLRKGAIVMMTIESLIAVVSLILTAFGLGYTIGNSKAQK